MNTDREFEFVDVNKCFNINIDNSCSVEFVTNRPPQLKYEQVPAWTIAAAKPEFSFNKNYNTVVRQELIRKPPKKQQNPRPAARGIGYGKGEPEDVSYYSPKSSAIIKTIIEIKEIVKSRVEKRNPEQKEIS